MTDRKLTTEEELSLWYEAQTHLVFLEPPISREHVDKLLAVLPKRHPDESFSDWLTRGTTAFHEIVLPERPSADGKFRIHLTAYLGKITIKVESLGLAADQFAHLTIASNDQTIAVIQLNADGNGECQVDDGPEMRKSLLRARIEKLKEI